MAPDERRAAIVDATLPLVFEHGSRVTVRLIAEAAGVAEGTIFTVFPDKDALMRAVAQKGLDPGPALRELGAIDRELPLRERLVALVAILEVRLRRAFILVAALGGIWPQPTEGEQQSYGRRVTESFLQAITDVIAPDADALRLPPSELAHLLWLITSAAHHPLRHDGRPLLPADQIVAVLLDGTRAPATTTTHSMSGGD